ncbi:MAG TPA: SMI1/KNR4 family protein [Myxococcaceae bacterium]|nr:SMI1/KNR4 family protein [Myxococcaceae bacterium]
MRGLLEDVSRRHFPYAPATPAEIEAFERRVGWSLDADLGAFYLHCNGAELFERRPDTPFRILPQFPLKNGPSVSDAPVSPAPFLRERALGSGGNRTRRHDIPFRSARRRASAAPRPSAGPGNCPARSLPALA